MSHNNHTESSRNQDADRHSFMDYLRMASDWRDPFPKTIVEREPITGCLVVREDLLEVGSKARFGHCLLQKIPKNKPIVYVAPRFGFAAISLSFLCHRDNRELHLFMPGCKVVSAHQAYALSQGAIPHFHRIAAMPNLNLIAARWAKEKGAEFIPLGLRHPLVTAAICRTANELTFERRVVQPKAVWTAMSTGVLSRALQLRWPKVPFYGVAVARNIHEGERGRAMIYSHPKQFAQPATTPPPFASALNYDAKVWDYISQYDVEDHLFWNVAGEVPAVPSHWYDQPSNVPWSK